MKIAVVGTGISGLTCAHYLGANHDVVLFEGRDRVGGHTNTVTVFEGPRPVPIDTGFIVFNTKTYPNFVRLLGELGVGWANSDMGFSVRSDRRDFEYNARGLSRMFSQRRRLASPRHWRMVMDILRFFDEGRELLDEGTEIPMLEWLRERNYSDAFVDDHFLPLLRAVWSANREVAESFPARFLVRFFHNHGFLQVKDRQPWLTIPGGSHTYVRAILSRFSGEVRTSAAVESIARSADGVVVRSNGAAEQFDHVVVACHADQALSIVDDPSATESSILSAIPYQKNTAVLHTDERVMPKHRRTWASWNAHLDDEGVDGACLTYWMNELQPLGAELDYFVTLNREQAIRPQHVIRTFEYAHPVFTLEGVRAQARHAEMIDRDGISYCGAYWRNGFHEDGVASALAVVERLRTKQRLGAAA